MDTGRAGAPTQWQKTLAGYESREVSHGCSTSSVYCLSKDRVPLLYLKTESVSNFAELPVECDKLTWLASQGIPCPKVTDFITANERHWLMIEALPGHDLSQDQLITPEQVLDVITSALTRLHELPIENCPFDESLDEKINLATQRMKAGLVDEGDFDTERASLPIRTLHKQLLADRPKSEKLVVTHGDACLPNFMAIGGELSGVIDCGRLGLADRAQDIALAARSIEHNLGKEWRERFLTDYGFNCGDQTLAYYRLLDEFF